MKIVFNCRALTVGFYLTGVLLIEGILSSTSDESIIIFPNILRGSRDKLQAAPRPNVCVSRIWSQFIFRTCQVSLEFRSVARDGFGSLIVTCRGQTSRTSPVRREGFWNTFGSWRFQLRGFGIGRQSPWRTLATPLGFPAVTERVTRW